MSAISDIKRTPLDVMRVCQKGEHVITISKFDMNYVIIVHQINGIVVSVNKAERKMGWLHMTDDNLVKEVYKPAPAKYRYDINVLVLPTDDVRYHGIIYSDDYADKPETILALADDVIKGSVLAYSVGDTELKFDISVYDKTNEQYKLIEYFNSDIKHLTINKPMAKNYFVNKLIHNDTVVAESNKEEEPIKDFMANNSQRISDYCKNYELPNGTEMIYTQTRSRAVTITTAIGYIED
jgi:hypothetical protein